MMVKKYFLLLFASVVCYVSVTSQVGYGFTLNNDLYQRYNNPSDGIAGNSSGSFLLNVAVGPKIWIGGNNFSVSIETTANLGLLGLDVDDYKGLGMLSIPVLAHLNFGGLSAMDREGKMGFSIGGGIQFNRTELYYITASKKEMGVTRSFFRTIVGEFGYGFGMSGFTIFPFVRLGYELDASGNSFNFGIRYGFNLPKLKQISDPESDL